ncbi:hypothetical protein EMPS_00963 [Entomortierella parvispora]|uniref:Uncharacterized protein n=1 Tax=Entomortierella parvispora TaxID=205924 RepID=A0A9P3LSC3_9FUNG|nr:hypothetical protein EMPS_00963 [Entomortierella parvispora]
MAFSKSLVLVTLSAALALLGSTSANIQFNRINMTTAIKPGATMTLSWTDIPAPTNTVLNTLPFNLTLRALSGQRYNIQNLVPQTQLTMTVTIPSDATGGQHSFYCDYTGTDGLKSTSSNQFNVTGAYITTTMPAPTTTAMTLPLPTNSTPKGNDGGLSGGALGGIIGGVVAVLLLIALVFFARNRRLARERGESSRLEDTKERYEDRSVEGRSGPMPPMSAPPGGPNGYPQDGPGEAMMMGGVAGAAAAHGARAGSPAISGPTSLSPRQQHQPYSPPQMHQPAPGSPGGPMMGMPPHQQQPYPGGPFNQPPPHQQQFQNQHHPGGDRDSFESEPESAYDPSRFTLQQMNVQQGGSVMRNNSNAMMRGPGGPNDGSSLSYSPSGRSNMSGNDPRFQNRSNMSSPHPHNPFQDPELMAAAAGGAGMITHHHQQQQQQYQQQQQGGRGSPLMMQRQLSQNRGLNGMPRSQSPMRSASPYNREIEMQPLDVQQHQYEQQQRVLQRQQQQREQEQKQREQEQQQQQQQQAPSGPAQTQPAPPKSAGPVDPSAPYSPANFDDKTEIDEDGVPVYNGYRDTIFGAYAPQGDDDEDEEEVPMPIIPPSALAKVGEQIHHQQQSKPEDEESSSEGGPGVQRKKSVKFTGVPPSGPIVVPTAASGSAPVPQQQQHQQQQHQQQHQMYHSEGEDHDDEDDEFYEDEDEHDIKMRMLESEIPSPTVSSSNPRPPFINTTPGSSPLNQHTQQHSANAMSPVRGYGSPTQYHQTSPKAQGHNQGNQYQGGFVAPPPPNQQQQAASNNLMASSNLGGFYEDVLAAVDKNAKTLPASSASPTSNKPSFLQGPPPPSATSAPPPPQQQQSSQQHYVQQQHIPPPQPTHMQPVPLHQEVFGAPSPRIVPAQLPGSGPLSPRSPNAKPVVSPRSAARPPASQQQQQQQQQQQKTQQYRDADEDAFYESSLL